MLDTFGMSTIMRILLDILEIIIGLAILIVSSGMTCSIIICQNGVIGGIYNTNVSLYFFLTKKKRIYDSLVELDPLTIHDHEFESNSLLNP